MRPSSPTVEEVIDFVRDFTGSRRSITAKTYLEEDLGVTGGDGIELLDAAETHFGVALSTPENGFRAAFGLGPDEYLFGPEGLDLLGITGLLRWMRGEPKPVVRDLTIEQLHQAISTSHPPDSPAAV